eukprot:CAMPEP_0175841558 /NCGR_PEP_ID=MMETSP0107_2-20121207/20000_1 /TAXON_ID=195067 ORGANISM="Goniomonas pacifica, Strain CCMP1869" /NCGR_SAMPLE_ID=MMETSP0107_2 /ASSEMBLY_ACC=CAM_ASM_000203 /LENGTH=143 /DNA_ID=CAMNT_0017155547 /DNA_START=297 /DNA_END=725 /DNA_ORIENTATION=+
MVLPQLSEPFPHQLLEATKRRAMDTPHDFYKVACELERCVLNFDRLLFGEDEAEIYVDEMTILVEHDILVVAVLDLQQVACKRVPSQRTHKIAPGMFESGGRSPAIAGGGEILEKRRVLHVVVEAQPKVLLEVVKGDGVGDSL